MNITSPAGREAIAGLAGFDLIGELTTGYRRVQLAEDAIAQAGEEHPETADLFWHGFPLLYCTHPLMDRNGHLFMAHCAELLTRLASGADTRPGTAAELCAVFAEVSPHNHLTLAGNVLYARLFCQVYPERGPGITGGLAHAGWVSGSDVSYLERGLRRRLAQPGRRLPAGLSCDGRHHGVPVACRFHTALFPAIPATSRPRKSPPAKPAPPPYEAGGELTLF